MSNDLEILIKAKNLTQEAFDQLKQQVEAAGGEVQKFNTGMGSAAAGGLAFGAAAGVAGAAVSELTKYAGEAYSALLDVVKGFVAAGSAIDDMRLKTALGAKEIQLLAYQGSLVGVSMETMGTGVVRMSKNIEEGSSKVRSAIGNLGLSITALQAMSPAEQFNAIATAIRGLQTPGEQAAATFAIFGRNAAILQVIRSDTEAARDSFERLGFAMSDDAVKGADALGDSVTTLTATWDGLKNKLGEVIVTNTGANEVVGGLTILLADVAKGGDGAETAMGKFVARLGSFLAIASPVVGALDLIAAGLRNIAAEELPGVAAASRDTFGQMAADQIDFLAIESAGERQAAQDVKDAEAAKKAAVRESAAERLRLEKELQKDLLDAEKFKWDEAKKQDADYLKAYEAGLKEQDAASKAAADSYLTNWKASIDQVKKAEDELAELEKQWDEEEARRKQKEIEDMRRFGEEVRRAGEMFGGFAGQVISLGGGVIGMLANMKDEAIQNASVWEKLGMAMAGAMAAYQSGSVVGGIGAGASAGAAFGLPGAIVGGLVGGVLGLFGGKSKDKKEMEELKKQFLEAEGGLEALKAQADIAGVSLDKLFDARKAKEMEKAIADIKKQLDSWEEAEQKTLAAMEKYGITIDQMGESFAQLELDKQFGDLYESYQLLIGAGADVSLVNEKMAADINAYVQQTIAAGVEIPLAMRPILESLIQQGLLFDAAGNQITDISQLNFAETVTQQVQQIVSAVNDLVDALRQALGLGGELGGMFGNQGTFNGGTYNGPPKPLGGGSASGGYFPAIPGGYLRNIAEGGEDEAVLNTRQMRALLAEAVAGAAAANGGSMGEGGSVVVHSTLQLDGRPVAKSMSKASRRGQLRLHPRGTRAGRW